MVRCISMEDKQLKDKNDLNEGRRKKVLCVACLCVCGCGGVCVSSKEIRNNKVALAHNI